MAATWDPEEAHVGQTTTSIYRDEKAIAANSSDCGDNPSKPKKICATEGSQLLKSQTKVTADANSGILNLCYEILLKILRFVTWAPPNMRASRIAFTDVQLVCKYWHQVALSDSHLLLSKVQIKGRYFSGAIDHPRWSGYLKDAPIDLFIEDVCEDGSIPEGKYSLSECGMRRLCGSIISRENQMRLIDCRFYMDKTGSQLVSSLCDTTKPSFPQLSQLSLRYLPHVNSANQYAKYLDPFVLFNRMHDMEVLQSNGVVSPIHEIQPRFPRLTTLMLSNMLPSFFQDMNLFLLALHSPNLVNLVLDKVHPTVPTSSKPPMLLSKVKRLWLSPVDGIITHYFKTTITCPNVEALHIVDAPPEAFASLLLNTTGLFPRVRELYLAMLYPQQPSILWPVGKWLYRMPNVEDIELDTIPSEMLDMLLLPAPAPENPHCPDLFPPEGAQLLPRLRQVQVRNTVLTDLSKTVFQSI